MSPLDAFRRRRDGRARITGHRGVRRDGGPVENTLGAFAEAADAGADAIELDVRLSASGDVVVLHDPTLERVTRGADARAAADLTSRELASIDLDGAGVPTLAEVLAFARSRRVAVNVEMKRDVPSRAALARAVARLLSGWDRRHAVLVSCFDPAMLALLAALAPHVPRASLQHRVWWHRVGALGVAPSIAHALHLERTIASPDLVRRARARGLVVQVWTVNSPAEARDLVALGVDGLITDTPAEIAAALAESALRGAIPGR